MRARFFELQTIGDKTLTRTIYCDRFPVVFEQSENGAVGLVARVNGEPACVLEEQDGNLVLTRATDETFLNGAPIERGGIAPGDRLKIGRTDYVVSYERVSSAALPETVFRISTAPAQHVSPRADVAATGGRPVPPVTERPPGSSSGSTV